MSNIELKHIYKVYDNKVVAVSDFNLEISDNEFVIFVGPSGCGKSTTLRMIAGLEAITSGELYIDGELMNDVLPKNRNIAMVFQNYALYPHMTVYQNIAFSLKMKKMPKDEIRQKVEEVASVLGLTEYLTRKPSALSGGQRQRVALGRAMVRNPKAFLLDEPLSNLDAKLRAAMRTEIIKLHQKLQTTFIYVTHDQVEAMTMGTRIVVMKDGFTQQVGAPQYIYDHPANKFVAAFIGTPQMNFFDGVLRSDGTIEFDNGKKLQLSKTQLENLVDFADGKEIVFGIRPEDIHADQEHAEKLPFKLNCHVELEEKLGSETILYCMLDAPQKDTIITDVASAQLIAKVDNKTVVNGKEITLSVDTSRIHVFDKETERNMLKELNV